MDSFNFQMNPDPVVTHSDPDPAWTSLEIRVLSQLEFWGLDPDPDILGFDQDRT